MILLAIVCTLSIAGVRHFAREVFNPIGFIAIRADQGLMMIGLDSPTTALLIGEFVYAWMRAFIIYCMAVVPFRFHLQADRRLIYVVLLTSYVGSSSLWYAIDLLLPGVSQVLFSGPPSYKAIALYLVGHIFAWYFFFYNLFLPKWER